MKYSSDSRVAIIGGGLGGLACAIRLAASGCKVTVCEQQPELGGKLQRVQDAGYRFDRGPSTITMLDSFRSVFTSAGKQMDEYLTFYPIHPLTRNVFADGSVVDLVQDRGVMEEQIAAYSPEDALRYRGFMKEAGELYRIGEQQFMSKLLVDWKDKLSLPLAASLFRIRPFTSLQSLLSRYFRHPNTLALFGRYATYVGSSPYQAPSIFTMLASLEADRGIYGVYGGTYEIVRAFARLATELGVEILTDTKVHRIIVAAGRVTGLETNRGEIQSDIVVANGDVLSISEHLLSPAERPSMTDNRINKYEPSLSGFVTLLGIQDKDPHLRHHTVFYPEDYEAEFEDIFKRRVAPRKPTLYICCTSETETDTAPEGHSSLFVLANAPYLSDQWNWEREKSAYGDLIVERLERACGLRDLASRTHLRMHYTPQDLHRDTSAHRGAIYGISSNGSAQTFTRPSNRSKDVRGLWFVGGTTHPGGGTPVVTASGRMVAERILRDEIGWNH
ncbi:phytoene dehydrogenase [Paenibacillus swuensis]|uniref:4,4'-diaponeurosporene oxygenase n=1 Tax=Paenibacillus swuensis TaxID=1178515 RepID=A0A172TJM8_9BACL|nr:phytoene desaturase family protein [Paenibacillus swuensis]ANE47255.1 phytoene dehydrogenase [Paenibacillus swuensis]